MTGQRVPAPPTGAPSAVGVSSGTAVQPAPGRRTTVRPARVAGATPRRYRWFQLIVVALAAGIAILAGVTAAAIDTGGQRAVASAEAYRAASTAQTTLWQAQAAAARAVLAPGGEQAATARTLADEAAAALLGLAASEGSSPELEAAQQSVIEYARLAAVALAAPAGDAPALVEAASAQLIDATLPALETLRDMSAAGATPGTTSGWAPALVAAAWLAAVVTLALGWSVAVSSHRVLNPGLAAAMVCFVVIASGSTAALGAQPGEDEFTALSRASTARAAIAEADARLAGDAALRTWDVGDTTVTDLLAAASAVRALPDGTELSLRQVRPAFSATGQALAAGDWEKAADAVAGDQQTAAADFDQTAAEAIGAATDGYAQVVAGRGTAVVAAALVAAALCAFAAAAGVAGLGSRLKEYR